MQYHIRKKAVMIMLMCLISFTFLCAGPVFAVQANPHQASEFAGMPAYKMSDIKIMKQQITKIPPKVQIKLPANIADRKADLSCTINTYYDLARTRQIQGHIWDMSTAATFGMPHPWQVNWEIVVMNNGTATASNFNINLHFTNPAGMTPAHQYFNEVETLAPGEAAVIKYYFRPVGPYLYGKGTRLDTKTDFPPRIPESSETNNNCANWVNFVP